MKKLIAILRKKVRGINYGMYCFVFWGIVAIVVLRLVGLTSTIEKSLIYLIMILVGLLVLPAISEFSIGGSGAYLSVKTKVDEAAKKDVEINDKESEQELKTAGAKISVKEIRKKILEKFCSANPLTVENFETNCQISVSDDRIGGLNPVFSWYTNIDGDEVLYEPKFTAINSSFYNKLYVMLSKIAVYNEQTCKHLELVLIVVVKRETSGLGVWDADLDKLKVCFKKSMEDKILKIKEIEI